MYISRIAKVLNGMEKERKRVKAVSMSGVVKAAVLVPVFENLNSNGDIKNIFIVFTKRTESVRDHKGQISFPGGVSEGDETPEETALRETEEELGIKRDSITLLGLLDDIITITGYIVTPVVGELKNLNFKPNRDEVENILVFSIEDIINAKYHEEYWRWEFHINETVVWGATARILKSFLQLCFPEWRKK